MTESSSVCGAMAGSCTRWWTRPRLAAGVWASATFGGTHRSRSAPSGPCGPEGDRGRGRPDVVGRVHPALPRPRLRHYRRMGWALSVGLSFCYSVAVFRLRAIRDSARGAGAGARVAGVCWNRARQLLRRTGPRKVDRSRTDCLGVGRLLPLRTSGATASGQSWGAARVAMSTWPAIPTLVRGSWSRSSTAALRTGGGGRPGVVTGTCSFAPGSSERRPRL